MTRSITTAATTRKKTTAIRSATRKKAVANRNNGPATASKEKKQQPHIRATATPLEATCLSDGVSLVQSVVVNNAKENANGTTTISTPPVILPWVAFGTYRLRTNDVLKVTMEALRAGYRCIDTAFIYGGETTERQVGKALQQHLQHNRRAELCIITKHWRKYHGYDATLKCLNLSLRRLQLDYIDLYLMHWPGPAYSTMNRKKSVLEEQGPWAYATTPSEHMVALRAETWRAMEDAILVHGKVRAIGVSNCTVAHLETLKRTARIWPPAVNQVECHPLYQNEELRAYCAREGIVLQAYAVLGGQDASKAKWKEIGCSGKSLLECPTVGNIARDVQRTPGQVLLRYALQRGCAVAVKTGTKERLAENAQIFDFVLSKKHMGALNKLERPKGEGRLCWKNDPLRMMDFA